MYGIPRTQGGEAASGHVLPRAQLLLTFRPCVLAARRPPPHTFNPSAPSAPRAPAHTSPRACEALFARLLELAPACACCMKGGVDIEYLSISSYRCLRGESPWSSSVGRATPRCCAPRSHQARPSRPQQPRGGLSVALGGSMGGGAGRGDAGASPLPAIPSPASRGTVPRRGAVSGRSRATLGGPRSPQPPTGREGRAPRCLFASRLSRTCGAPWGARGGVYDI